MIKDYLLKNLYAQAVDDAIKECQLAGENKAWTFEKYHVHAVLMEVSKVIESILDTDISRDQGNILYALRETLAEHFYTNSSGDQKN